MLDLKQKHANAFEARFARDQAAGTARQSQTIMVFTIVTIIFLPLSFIASFFAININEFPRTDSGPNLPLGYVSKYMFGIGLAFSIPLIIIAVRLDDIADLMNESKRRINQWRRVKEKEVVNDGVGEGRLDMLRREEAFSIARSSRKSLDTDWLRGRISMPARPVSARTEKPTGFRMRVSQDIERGPVVELRDFGR
jgi:hypothetical protein